MEEIQKRIELLEQEKKLLEDINELYKSIAEHKSQDKITYVPYPVYPTYPPYPQVTYTTGTDAKEYSLS